MSNLFNAMLCHVRMKNLCSGWSREQFWRSAGQQPWSRHSKATWPWGQGKKTKNEKTLKKTISLQTIWIFCSYFFAFKPWSNKLLSPTLLSKLSTIFYKTDKLNASVFGMRLWFAGTSYFWILGRTRKEQICLNYHLSETEGGNSVFRKNAFCIPL